MSSPRSALAHILEHPEMRRQEAGIAETLAMPETVLQSRTDSAVRLFYRAYKGLSVGDKYLCVVVKYTEATRFVITAYFTDKVKKGEVLWKK